MALFGSMMGDVEDDPFFGSHMRHMQHMNNMMNSLFSDPFSMMGGIGPLAIAGPHHGSALMPFMPQMPSLNRLYPAGLDGHMSAGSSFSSSTFVMSSGPNGKPQVISSSSSTKIGPNGIKETRKTLQDSRTGTKKLCIGHHIGERAHLIEREQNLYSGNAEESQEFINIEEDEAEDFDKEFQTKAGCSQANHRAAITAGGLPPLLALPAPPAPPASAERARSVRPTARRPLRTGVSPLAALSPPQTSSSVRDVYGSSHPQRHKYKHHKSSQRHPAND